MKIVVLDFDGVINSRKYMISIGADKWDDEFNQFDPAAIDRLNTITNATGAKIVVSSTWRLPYLNDDQGIYRLQDLLLKQGVDAEIIGMTPDHVVPMNNILIANGTRATEIQTWLDENPKVKQFVILDDELILGLEKYQVRTFFEDGLQDHHVKQAIFILET
jgi:hypothetical protein